MSHHSNATGFIDLRSDTVTHPTPAMRRAMAEAEVGDDQYGEDPTVRRLEEYAAELMGKEAAMLVISGTMGNLVSMLTHCERGDEAILGDECHIYYYEGGGSAALGGIPFNLRRNEPNGELNLDDVRASIRPNSPGYPKTGVIAIENTHNRCGGTVLSLDYLRGLRRVASEAGIPLHMDGARVFNAAAALGVPESTITAEVDSVQFCLSKGLAAPLGSMVAGSTEFIAQARRRRHQLGGDMRQAGVFAAAGLVALQQMRERLPEDHARARRIAEGLANIPGVTINLDTVQSNIVIFNPPAGVSHEQVIAKFRERGIIISSYGTRGLRIVTHYQITDDAVEKALSAANDILARQSPLVGSGISANA